MEKLGSQVTDFCVCFGGGAQAKIGRLFRPWRGRPSSSSSFLFSSRAPLPQKQRPFEPAQNAFKHLHRPSSLVRTSSSSLCIIPPPFALPLTPTLSFSKPPVFEFSHGSFVLPTSLLFPSIVCRRSLQPLMAWSRHNKDLPRLTTTRTIMGRSSTTKYSTLQNTTSLQQRCSMCGGSGNGGTAQRPKIGSTG